MMVAWWTRRSIAAKVAERAFESELAPRQLETLHELVGAGERHAATALDEREADGGGQVALAGAGRSEQQQ
jgi:hypothetical protein